MTAAGRRIEPANRTTWGMDPLGDAGADESPKGPAVDADRCGLFEGHDAMLRGGDVGQGAEFGMHRAISPHRSPGP